MVSWLLVYTHSAHQLGLGDRMLTVEEVRGLYADADLTHDFDHVLRVWCLSEWLAKAEGADMKIVKAAALLHDAHQAGVSDVRATHHLASAEVACRVLESDGWNSDDIGAVQHCIRAHRYRSPERPSTIEAMCLFDADKLDALGAIGVARTIGYVALSGEPYYAEPSDKFLRSGQREPGEPYSAYHEFIFKLSKLVDSLHTASARTMAEERHDTMVMFFERLRAESMAAM